MARLITPKPSLLRGGLSKIIGVYKWEERVIISVEHSVKDAVIDFYEVTYLYYFLNYYFTLFNHSIHNIRSFNSLEGSSSQSRLLRNLDVIK